MAVLPIEGFKGVIEKIIFKQSNFVTDRTTTMQFRKMQFEIFGSLVPIQYHSKCTYHLNPNFISLIFVFFLCFFFFLLQPLPGHCLCSNSDHRQVFTPIYQALSLTWGNFFNKNAQILHTRANMTTDWL